MNFDQFILIFRDIRMKTSRWAAKDTEPGLTVKLHKHTWLYDVGKPFQ